MTLVVATFYKFVELPDYVQMQAPLLTECLTQNIRGTILLAQEGLNATVAGTRQGIDNILNFLKSDARLADLEHKESLTDAPPFDRMKVKLKREIVTLGLPQVNPARQVGTYIEPKDWNQLISDPDVMVIDTRNQYEVAIGSFERAINPQTDSFRQFPEYVQQNLDPGSHKKVALFCTGGIRCEKATAFMLEAGFQEVYHLKGGILKYLEEVPAEDSLWQGECFVFDQRVAVQQGLVEGSYEMCLSCGHPISEADKAAPEYEVGICCPHCYGSLSPEKRVRQEARRQQRHLWR